MDSLFGGEITGAARFVIAFVVVLLLIGIVAWLVRRFGSGALTSTGARGRQPRLAVIDAATVDTRRRLVLVRRDNVEHLLMIGGPTDIVIEPNIVRAAGAPRDVPPPRAVALPEAMPRAVSLDEGTQWPLQPQPEPARPQRNPAPQWSAPGQTPADPASRVQRADTLADLADALATQQPNEAASTDIVPEPLVPHATRQPTSSEATQYATPESDENLAEMAQRLEAALRNPTVAEPRLGVAPAVEAPPILDPVAEAPHQAPTPTVQPELAAPRPGQSKNFYENLEQEMASLLGRPTGKT